MKRRIRIATAVGAIGAACLLLIPLANGAGAATQVSDYQMNGVARGVALGFGFKDFVLARIIDLGIPHASNELNTSAGASAMSEAAQAYPGDVLIGAIHHPEDPDGLPGGYPGYSVSKYPPGQSESRNVTGSFFGEETGFPTTVGPLGIDNGHLETNARERLASASTTTQRLLILGDAAAPFMTIGSLGSTTSAKAESSRVTQIARTTAKDIVITPSEGMTIKIGSLVSDATASSDGTTSDGNAKLTLSDVRVISGTDEFGATIDSKGIHLAGPIPEEAPSSIDIDLAQNIANATKGLQNSGITIRTADPVKIVDGASTEASIGGLIVRLTGDVPRIPVAQQVLNQILGPIFDEIPTQCGLIPQIPVCISPQLIPTGGTGTITSVAIGSVNVLSAASTGFVQTPIGGGNGGFGPGPVGDLGPGVPPGDFGNGGVVPPGQPTQQGRPRLFGLVAKMPAGALLGGGLAFLVIAMAMTIGPSLRRWRAAT